MSRALCVVVLVTAAGCRSSSPSTLSLGRPVRQYSIVFRVEESGRTTIERLTVDRPFASHLVLEGSERITALGRLATRSTGGPWTVLEVPPAPAGRDLRVDIALAEGRRRGLVERRGQKTVAGRRCQLYRAGGPVLSGSLTGDRPARRRHTDFCVGRGSLVLEQVEVEDGAVVRRARATDVTTGDSVAAVPPVPAVEPVSDRAGGGRTRPVEAGAPVPFARTFQLAAPAGYTHVGRFAVVPPQETGTASYTDVFARDADLLLVDQGANAAGRPPFDTARPTSPVELAPLGEAELVLDAQPGAD